MAITLFAVLDPGVVCSCALLLNSSVICWQASKGMAVRVLESIRDFRPPFDAVATVERLLSSVPKKYLAGLRAITITTSEDLSGKRRRTVYRYRSGSRVAYRDALGFYQQKWRSDEARIVLLIDNIVEGWPRWLFWFALPRDLAVGAALSPASSTFVHRRQLDLCTPVAAEAAGLWETRSVFQGVWEGAGGGSGEQPSTPRQTGGRGDGGPGEEGAVSTGRASGLGLPASAALGRLGAVALT